ncbi:MAG: hypothetical protein K9I85_04630 [Saprospiraceae bacterium]|nr:hypothetical protein [Saprospiraceae bacterium]
MSTNKILMSGLVAGIVAFFLGWIVWGMILMGMSESMSGSATGVSRGEDDMIWWALIVGNLLFGFLYAYIFGRWANITTAATGAKAGAMIGLIMSASWDLTMYGTTNVMTLNGVFIDIIASTVVSAIIGAVAAWMLGRGN